MKSLSARPIGCSPFPVVEIEVALSDIADAEIQLRRELDELRHENDELRQRTLEHWAAVAKSDASVSQVVNGMQSSLSWRVTKPLRVVRDLQIKAARVGYLRALSKSSGYLRRVLGNRGRN